MSERFCPYCMRDLSEGEKICPVCGCGAEVSAAPHHLPTGTVLRSGNGHRFLFGTIKGEGGFGLTYIGKELGSGLLVAIKEYFPFRCQPQRLPEGQVKPGEGFGDIYAHGMRSFLSEASMLRAVCHIPSIVHVMDYFEANGTAYMVMEYLQGATLYQVMQTKERVAPEELLPKLIPLMYDLGTLHESGVLHRDIAPDNIMWMPDGSLRLLDFGCARSLEDGRSMTVVLKPGFAPIEQYQTRGQGACTDIYGLCATLYYCLTGRVPPASPERLTATFDNQPDPLVPPSQLGVVLPAQQERLLLWGLALQPSLRPGSMAELASRLEKTFGETEKREETENKKKPEDMKEMKKPAERMTEERGRQGGGLPLEESGLPELEAGNAAGEVSFPPEETGAKNRTVLQIGLVPTAAVLAGVGLLVFILFIILGNL